MTTRSFVKFEPTAKDVSRFWSKVNITGPDDCWEWQGTIRNDDYGCFHIAGRHLIASRVAWQISNKRQPDGLVCHTCDNPKCVNPSHLWLGDDHANHIDMSKKLRGREQTKSHCKNGHEFSPENTYVWVKRPNGRICRACNRANVAKLKAKRA